MAFIRELDRAAPEWGRRLVGAMVAAAVVLLAADGAAGAEGTPDYAVTSTSGLYEAPPSTATAVSSTATPTAGVDLPFEFPYFGSRYDRVRVSIGGYLTFGNSATSAVVAGQDPSNIQPGSAADGACAPLWNGLAVPALQSTYSWTAGTAPNRRFIVSWEGVGLYSGATATLTFQVKLHEDSGLIEFAYKPSGTPSTWTNLSYSIGLVAPGADPRWVAPVNTSTNNTGHPGSDYRFAPLPVTWSGTLAYERLTPTESGLGTTPTAAPIAALELAAYTTGGALAARGSTAADGSFEVHAFRGPPGSTVDLVALARGTGFSVRDGSGTVATYTAAGGVDATASVALGSTTITAAADPTAAFRGPANVASTLSRARAWVVARTSVVVPDLDVELDLASNAVTSYSRAIGTDLASLRVAGPVAANPDMWDDGVLLVAYGRHVLAALTAPQTTSIDNRVDAVTDDVNAFAVGWGQMLLPAVTGEVVWIDTGSPGGPAIIDLETPSLASARGPDVGGWVGAALFDLIDPANEDHDRSDGSASGGTRIVTALESLAATPDAAPFAGAWRDAGFDSLALSRNFIAHGLLPDDAFEPNDDSNEPAVGPALASIRGGHVLNIGNEDWFDLVLPTAVPDLLVEVAANRVANPATVEFELFDATGARIDGKEDAGFGPVLLALGALDAGTYRVRIAHAAGFALPDYSLQASERLRIDTTPLHDWTVGFPYTRSLAMSGGVGTRGLRVETGTSPPGLTFDAGAQRVSGTPITTGSYDFLLIAHDSGTPEHIVPVSHHVEINAVLSLQFGEFLPLPLGSPTDVTLGHEGGTLPLTVAVADGALPAGLVTFADDLRVAGTATTPGSSALSLRATDVAGSSSEATTTVVVCVRAEPQEKTTATLAAGAASSGYFVDAVRGSRLSLAAAPAPKRAKRRLRATVLDTTGSPVEGARVKLKSGGKKVAVTVPSVPVSGRYFVVLSAEAGEETELIGAASVSAPKADKGGFEDVVSGDRVTIEFGALAGARVRLSAKAAKKADLTLAALALIGPDGSPLPLTDAATSKGPKLNVDTVVPTSGTWRLVVRASGSGSGSVKYKLKLTRPKGVTFDAD